MWAQTHTYTKLICSSQHIRGVRFKNVKSSQFPWHAKLEFSVLLPQIVLMRGRDYCTVGYVWRVARVCVGGGLQEAGSLYSSILGDKDTAGDGAKCELWSTTGQILTACITSWKTHLEINAWFMRKFILHKYADRHTAMQPVCVKSTKDDIFFPFRSNREDICNMKQLHCERAIGDFIQN